MFISKERQTQKSKTSCLPLEVLVRKIGVAAQHVVAQATRRLGGDFDRVLEQADWEVGVRVAGEPKTEALLWFVLSKRQGGERSEVMSSGCGKLRAYRRLAEGDLLDDLLELRQPGHAQVDVRLYAKCIRRQCSNMNGAHHRTR